MHFLSLFFVLLACAGVVFGQASPAPMPNEKPVTYDGKNPKVDKSRLRDLKGTVKDPAGNAIEGAIVQLKNLRTGKTVNFITKKDGTYLFYDLDMDIDFQLAASQKAFGEPVKKTLSKYDTRKQPNLNFELEPKKPS
jgi:hypothetical protein